MTPPSPSAADSFLFGRYRLVRELGRGGMGVVHRAVSEGPQGFSRACVIKRIVPHLSSDPGFVQALVAEARLSGLLVHPGIVQLYEFGQSGGEYFLAMEYVDGISLQQALQRARVRNQPLPPGVVALIAAELALALGYAHALRDDSGRPLEVVHRDVSPSNVMLGRAGTVKLLDFGIARAALEMRDEQTRSGTLKGKVAYMSPEQADGLAIDGRSDLFALGVLVWEALTLRRLFAGPDDLATLRLVREARVSATGVDAELDAVLLRMLARDPAARWSSGDELAAALQPIAHRLDGNTFSLRRFVEAALAAGPAEPAATTPSGRATTPRPASPPSSADGPTVLTQPRKTRTTSRRLAAPVDDDAGASAPPVRAGYEVKGSLVRAYQRVVAEQGLMPAVLAAVSPETRRALVELPLSNAWTDAMVIEEMMIAVENLRGIDSVRALTRAGQTAGLMQFLQPVAASMLRLFGATPHTLLSRFSTFTKSNVRGLEFSWHLESERAGRLTVVFPRKHIPFSAFVGFESGASIICEMCGLCGRIGAAEVEHDGTTGIIRIAW